TGPVDVAVLSSAQPMPLAVDVVEPAVLSGAACVVPQAVSARVSAPRVARAARDLFILWGSGKVFGSGSVGRRVGRSGGERGERAACAIVVTTSRRDLDTAGATVDARVDRQTVDL